MKRRAFLKASAATATVSTVPTVKANNCRFNDGELGYQEKSQILSSVQNFLVDNIVKGRWDAEKLAEKISDLANIPCYVLEKASDIKDKLVNKIPQIPELGEIDFVEFKENPEAYNWILERFEDITTVVSHLDFLPAKISSKLGEIGVSKLRNLTKYIPFFWCLDGLFSVSCEIHNKHENGERVKKETIRELFEYIGLFIIEIMLLSISGGYSVAFRFTGAVNQKLINRVGTKVGWEVYSWLLSEIHWCIRIIYSESMGVAISKSTETVANNLVKKTDMTKACAEKQVSDQVELIAEEGYPSEYTTWKNRQRQTDIMNSIEEMMSKLNDVMEDFFRNINHKIERWKSSLL